MAERAGNGRGRRLPTELVVILVVTLLVMIGGMLVALLREDFPFVPDATPVPATPVLLLPVAARVGTGAAVRGGLC